MSRQPQEMAGFRGAIHAAALECELSVPKLYQRFQMENLKFGRPLDGLRGSAGFRSWMEGNTEPQTTEYFFVARTLNARLKEIGKEPMLPELDAPPSLAPWGDGDGASPVPPTDGDSGYFLQVAV